VILEHTRVDGDTPGVIPLNGQLIHIGEQLVYEWAGVQWFSACACHRVVPVVVVLAQLDEAAEMGKPFGGHLITKFRLSPL
jgi:hypothetical protein